MSNITEREVFHQEYRATKEALDMALESLTGYLDHIADTKDLPTDTVVTDLSDLLDSMNTATNAGLETLKSVLLGD